ncbi:MAG: hypothetical protein UR25_C0005G0073 [Candidatus Nomurabacteria bacterium GW2011_GWE1_32_28]|uniref:Bacterial spore germination immunoglobulin-like domain-containing protein n=1 Tax=Candidatus Nomurabacteria bacterium GW2011_GWF1_31_48 TaxID=1618767 RepID=A0A0F9YTQ2_9BACT|nr:MAG: hypothetical protein UR10_C0006G0018 [Candidatus Nomurabacteria bacterium GW2011_GWF2_30_133]KKP28251.1 MAG: hypothetical protein UR18_C0007G0019 [Candidatus Nomurabacteria bacterium GW2011_GWE2_31_40]KKP29846.1 MAG: hypothetical protein UR19_C0007G0020 [Candidatus Nomurabacteria bacterium GW2011_GWF1_31_48]KKP34587.1 MAG: hypothetical protein UR25_C0005G0073 [Candidatus Nomurabacteria bacterium GW2011_GWE1_32_28]HAS80429.1 hypothetical protein [Candidatus Nomurabacteria bacterium]
MQDNFFGSKLNSILLLVLIILVSGAIYIMLQNKEVYLNVFQKEVPIENVVDKIQEPIQTRDGILGNKDDLVSFSILPYTKVHGILSYRGVIKGGYFFEGNILINILDVNKKVLKSSNAIATTDWMTIEPVDFEGNIDFRTLPKGSAYFEIHNDNPGAPDEGIGKSVLIPIIIE